MLDLAEGLTGPTTRGYSQIEERTLLGLTYVQATVSGPSRKRRRVRLLVDSGATYSLLPHGVCKALGLRAKRSLSFSLADGSEVKRRVSECHITLLGQDGHTPVILGEPGDVALLGTVTLEILGLVLDPFKRRLQAMHMHLASARDGTR
jgi:clan AA aspartic protease